VQNQRAAQTGLLRFATATSLLQAGDLFRAETALRECLEAIAGDSALRSLTGDAAYQLSQVCRLTHRQAEADYLLSLAARAFASAGPYLMLIRCQIELSWSHLLAGDLVAGDDALNRAASSLEKYPDECLEAAFRISRALSDSLAGSRAQADLVLRDLIDTGELTQIQLADAAWILAQNAVRRADSDAAASWMVTARTAAAEAWWPPQMDRIFAQ
jgi:hypothetical protein